MELESHRSLMRAGAICAGRLATACQVGWNQPNRLEYERTRVELAKICPGTWTSLPDPWPPSSHPCRRTWCHWSARHSPFGTMWTRTGDTPLLRGIEGTACYSGDHKLQWTHWVKVDTVSYSETVSYNGDGELQCWQWVTVGTASYSLDSKLHWGQRVKVRTAS